MIQRRRQTIRALGCVDDTMIMVDVGLEPGVISCALHANRIDLSPQNAELQTMLSSYLTKKNADIKQGELLATQSALDVGPKAETALPFALDAFQMRDNSGGGNCLYFAIGSGGKNVTMSTSQVRRLRCQIAKLRSVLPDTKEEMGMPCDHREI